MEIKLEYEGKKSMKEVSDSFKNVLSSKEIQKTAAFTINETAKGASGMLKKEVVNEYTVKRKDLKDVITVSKKASGTPGGLYATLSYLYKGIPMNRFKNKSLDKKRKLGFVTYRKRIKGVMVEIKKGKSTILKHAFIKTMPNGHTGIWMHGDYVGGKFIPSDKRTSTGKPVISEMRTVSAYGMLTSKSMISKTNKYIDRILVEKYKVLLQKKLNKLQNER